jgi:hypothetical protein
MILIVKVSQFIYARLQVKTNRGNRQQREKEKARKKEKRSERQCAA